MKCPGQDTQFWNASAIFEAPCPQCGAQVEFFKDDTTRKCGRCGHRFVNPRMDFGCAAYCNFAEQCLGDLPAELVAQKEDLFKDRVAVAVKRHLKSDFKTIGRAARRAHHAEQLCQAEKGNLAAVIIAAYLWDLDGPAAGHGDLPVARALLSALKAPAPLIDKVCAIISGSAAANGNAVDRQVVTDAARVTDLEDELKKNAMRSLTEEDIQQRIPTANGQKYARQLFLCS